MMDEIKRFMEDRRFSSGFWTAMAIFAIVSCVLCLWTDPVDKINRFLCSALLILFLIQDVAERFQESQGEEQ